MAILAEFGQPKEYLQTLKVYSYYSTDWTKYLKHGENGLKINVCLIESGILAD